MGLKQRTKTELSSTLEAMPLMAGYQQPFTVPYQICSICTLKETVQAINVL